MRNLDVVATLALIAPVVLLQYRYLDASVVAALPTLTYLMVRCAWVGLGKARPPGPSTPLLDGVLGSLDRAVRLRLLRVLLAALVLTFVMVGVSSRDAVDVIYAVMEGATRLIHGVLPYGHMPGDVIHGDTYPLLSYVAYAPLAWLSPVQSVWDSVDLALGVAVLAALLGAFALDRVAARAVAHGDDAKELGLRSALLWLAFPPLLITVSTGTTDVVLGLLVLFAIVLWRRPLASVGVLAAAGWFKLVPFALVPLWLARLRGRRLLAAAGILAGSAAAVVGLLVAIGGAGGPAAMLHAVGYQFSRGSPQSVWSVLGLRWLQPLGQASVLALIVAATVHIARDHELAWSRTRIAALAGAVLIGIQLAADYWAFLYVVWTVPLILLSLLAQRDAGAEQVALEPRLAQLVPA
jgi:hypothetical protein